MKHLFSSGEAMFKKNEKKLLEGVLEGKFLEYESVEPDTKYYCVGVMNNQEVRVQFTVSETDFQSIKNRHNFGILMQSDILLADWENYEILKEDN